MKERSKFSSVISYFTKEKLIARILWKQDAWLPFASSEIRDWLFGAAEDIEGNPWKSYRKLFFSNYCDTMKAHCYHRKITWNFLLKWQRKRKDVKNKSLGRNNNEKNVYKIIEKGEKKIKESKKKNDKSGESEKLNNNL